MAMQFGAKKTFTSWLYSWGAVVVLLVICVFLGMSVWERFVIERQMAQRRVAVEGEYKTLNEQKEDLSDRVEYLSGDRGVEEELRRNFDVARPGEQVVIITGEAKAEVATTTLMNEEKTPWYIFWR